jgi:uncharacterized protein
MDSVTISVKEANSLSEKTFGLIFKPIAKPMLFRTRFGIHTFGMKYPIDVLVLDKENKTVTTKHNLLANRVFVWNPSYDKVIELPAGYCKKHEISRGTHVKLLIE